MSTYSVALWKAPVVREADEAETLLRPYEQRDDDSAFEPSADVAAVSNELLRRFPDSESEDGPWEAPPYQTDRVLNVTIGGVDDDDFDTVMNAIVELAREYRLVLYDREGPNVVLPDDPPPEPDQPMTLVDHVKMFALFGGVGLAGAAVFWLGWRIEVPVLDWLLMIVGGFFALLPVFWLFAIMLPEKKGG